MKPYSLDLRQRVVAAAESGAHTIAEVAELFSVGQTFVKKMLHWHRQGESLEPRHGGGAQASLQTEHREMLRTAVETRQDATLGELQQFLAAECQVTVSQATICRHLQALKLPRKKRVSTPANAARAFRRAFRRKVRAWEVKKFVFIDEMGSNIALARLFGRATPGERVVDHVPSARGENVSTIGALALDGVRAAWSLPGAVNGEILLLFVQQALAPRLNPGEIVFMDNVPTHKVAGVKEAIEAVGAWLVYLPAYSPDFSPIENCWSKVKTILRSIGARHLKDLLAALKRAFAAVTLEDIFGWFSHCGYQVALN